MRTRRSDPAVGPAHFFDQLIFSGSVSRLQKRGNARGMGRTNLHNQISQSLDRRVLRLSTNPG
jgi:hypothetical protein